MIKDVFLPLATIVVSMIVAFYTATYAIRREQRHGRFRLQEICRRYIINAYNAFDRNTNNIRNTPLDKKMYVEELKKINNSLDDLVKNFYFGVLVAKYPIVSKVLVQLGRELIQHESNDDFALNTGSIKDINELYDIIRKEVPSRYLQSEFETQIDNIFRTFLRDQNYLD